MFGSSDPVGKACETEMFRGMKEERRKIRVSKKLLEKKMCDEMEMMKVDERKNGRWNGNE